MIIYSISLLKNLIYIYRSNTLIYMFQVSNAFYRNRIKSVKKNLMTRHLVNRKKKLKSLYIFNLTMTRIPKISYLQHIDK